VPPGKVVVVIDRAALIVMDSAFVAEALNVSAAFTVKLEVPDAVGVPVIAPPELKESPVGRLPELSVQVSEPVPPVAARVWLYATLIVSAGRLDVVILTAALTTIESAFVADAPRVSAAFAVKLEVPLAVGVPVIAPPALMESPVGKVPALTVQVRAPVPPVAASA